MCEPQTDIFEPKHRHMWKFTGRTVSLYGDQVYLFKCKVKCRHTTWGPIPEIRSVRVMDFWAIPPEKGFKNCKDGTCEEYWCDLCSSYKKGIQEVCS